MEIRRVLTLPPEVQAVLDEQAKAKSLAQSEIPTTTETEMQIPNGDG